MIIGRKSIKYAKRDSIFLPSPPHKNNISLEEKTSKK